MWSKAKTVLGPRIKRLGHNAMSSLMEAAIEALTQRKAASDTAANAPLAVPAEAVADEAAASEPIVDPELTTDGSTEGGTGYHRRRRTRHRRHPF